VRPSPVAWRIAGGGHPGDVIGGNGRRPYIGGGFDQLALQPAAGNRQQY